MKTITIQLKKLHPALGEAIPLPQKMSSAAAAFDVAAALDTPLNLAPGKRALFSCGFSLATPEGYEVQVRPRSGLAIKHGIGLLNSPGTIDADYRGEVKVILINHGEVDFTIEPGMRVAQLVPAPVQPAIIEITTELSETQRGSGGFGSTGS